MTEIYDYSDYRTFIRDYYERNKAVNPAFSYRYLAQKSGINSSAFFKFVIEGKRNLTKQTILKTCAALKLADREAEYFENLVFFNQAKTLKEKNHFFDKLIGLQKAKNVKIVSEDHYDYFADWHHCIIRELVVITKFSGNFEKLAKMVRPRITSREAKDSVELLVRLGFLKALDDGSYIQTEPVISTGYNIKSHRIIQFQIQMLHRAVESFELAKSEERLTSSTTFGISEKMFRDFIKKVRELRATLMEMARTDEHPEAVYQLNINLFPLSERVKKVDA